jgi:hypothetical protein
MKKTKSKSLNVDTSSPDIKCAVNPSNLVEPVRINTSQMKTNNLNNETILTDRIISNKSRFHIRDKKLNEIKNGSKKCPLDNIHSVNDTMITMRKSFIKILVSPNFSNKYLKY